jgi:hypothetical protein
MCYQEIAEKNKGEGVLQSEECPKLHLTTGLRKGQKANKTALYWIPMTLAFLFRKPITIRKMLLRSILRIGLSAGRGGNNEISILVKTFYFSFNCLDNVLLCWNPQIL